MVELSEKMQLLYFITSFGLGKPVKLLSLLNGKSGLFSFIVVDVYSNGCAR